MTVTPTKPRSRSSPANCEPMICGGRMFSSSSTTLACRCSPRLGLRSELRWPMATSTKECISSSVAPSVHDSSRLACRWCFMNRVWIMRGMLSSSSVHTRRVRGAPSGASALATAPPSSATRGPVDCDSACAAAVGLSGAIGVVGCTAERGETRSGAMGFAHFMFVRLRLGTGATASMPPTATGVSSASVDSLLASMRLRSSG
mmetsp:Transcript_37309/g.119917  ORF Transcript_37309/g.119917 Transcript_37309/m.119917 type:complete len:203 (-) Transcript_37309:1830-2438(-)